MAYTTTEVFTPSTVARLTFVEREKINTRLVNALRTPGKQLVVFGRSGGGKTTLLENKLAQVYSFHFKSPCISGTTFDQLLLHAFDQLEPYFISARTAKLESEWSIELDAATKSVLEIRTQLGTKRTSTTENSEARALPPQLTPSLLAKLLGAKDACWVIEDLHKALPAERQRVAQSMKLFMDAAVGRMTHQ